MMQAVGVYEAHPADHPEAFCALEVPMPDGPQQQDLLIKVQAVGVNPVDTKVRRSVEGRLSEPKILGWDAVGTVVATGEATARFAVGDQVYYAGSLARPGCNSQYQLVDERIVGRKPKTLSPVAAAAMPLTTITAWEALFERLGLAYALPTDAANQAKQQTQPGQSLLVINGAGGVGSIAIQLAKRLAHVQVIATASRPETESWCRELGADHCLNHRQPLPEQLKALGYLAVDYVLCLYDTDRYWDAIAQLIKPQGKICTIVENKHPLAQSLLKRKSATHVWEFMFTRSLYGTDDMQNQGALLDCAADLFDQGILRSTLTEPLGALSVSTLAMAHSQLEAGRTIGKLALSVE